MKSKAEIAEWLNKCATKNPKCDKCPWRDEPVNERMMCADYLMADAAAVMISEIEARVQEVMGDEEQS